MGKQHSSEGLKRFLKEKIRTVLRLEVLLLLHHHQPRAFTPLEVANELAFENDATAQELRELEAIGVVVRSKNDKSKYSYHPLTATLDSMVEELAAGYSRQRISILTVILAQQRDRTRLFTEAFKIIRSND